MSDFRKMARLYEEKIEPFYVSEGDLHKYITDDPAWCSKLTGPIRVAHAALPDNITHLSPLITFEDRIDLSDRKRLKVATGKFLSGVTFANSGIEKIQNLEVGRRGFSSSASFAECIHLKVAEGIFHGRVMFSFSGIEKIGNLIIDETNQYGAAANFRYCKNLKTATGTYPGWVDFYGAGIKDIVNLKVTMPDMDNLAARFAKCGGLTCITGDYVGMVAIQDSPISEIRDLSIRVNEPHHTSLYVGSHPIKKITNFKYEGKLGGDEENIKRIHQLLGQEKAGGKGEFDDLF